MAVSQSEDTSGGQVEESSWWALKQVEQRTTGRSEMEEKCRRKEVPKRDLKIIVLHCAGKSIHLTSCQTYDERLSQRHHNKSHTPYEVQLVGRVRSTDYQP